MISQPRTTWIVRYDDKEGFAGKLLGVVTFTDGKSLKVWDGELHEQCKQLYAQSKARPFNILYTFRPNLKWGDALVSIEDGRPEHERYDAARALEEADHTPIGRFTRDMISKGVQTRLDDEKRQVSLDEVRERR